MPVRIRLNRVGATKQPAYRFVVSDSRNARNGRSLETLGHYNPRTNPIEINVDQDKAKDWLKRGAQPSETVARLFRRVGVLPAESAPAPKPARPPKKVKAAPAPAPVAAAVAAPAPAEAAAESEAVAEPEVAPTPEASAEPEPVAEEPVAEPVEEKA